MIIEIITLLVSQYHSRSHNNNILIFLNQSEILEKIIIDFVNMKANTVLLWSVLLAQLLSHPQLNFPSET
jgi:hypothetical protein